MNRDILMQLKYWKEKKDRKPLVLKGARQVGKTYIVPSIRPRKLFLMNG